MALIDVFFLIITLTLGAGGGYWLHILKQKQLKDTAAETAKRLIEEAENKKKEILLEGKNEVSRIQDEFRREERTLRNKIVEQENRLLEKEKKIDKTMQDLEIGEKKLGEKKIQLDALQKEIEMLKQTQTKEIERISHLSQAEAKAELLKQVEKESHEELFYAIQKSEQALREELGEKAKTLLAEAMQRCTSEVVSETTITLVDLPADDMKGRIIGKEGRNIQAFERYTGVDVIVDDTPGVIMISGFDMMRRYIAKLSLEKLMQDGRIHPAKIEETVEKVKKDVEKNIREVGEKVVYELRITNIHPELIKLLGKLKFRTYFGQNILKHSVEVCYIATHLAEELGADVNLCKRGALLHDIGKAMNHEVSGNHRTIGADIAKKYGVSADVIHIIESHEGDILPKSLEALIVSIANTISHSRPGAKREGIEQFINRLTEIEKMVGNIDAVENVFAVQAGRELRVLIHPEKADDLESYQLAKNIAQRLEKDLEYAGQIKISVLRESHVIEYAR